MAVKRQRHTRPKFTGVLSKPIDIPDELIIALHTYNEPQHTKTAIMNEVSSYVSQQRSERIIALVKHYKIDANHYPNLQTFLYDLLLKVAEDFIDGFKSGPGKNRRIGHEVPQRVTAVPLQCKFGCSLGMES